MSGWFIPYDEMGSSGVVGPLPTEQAAWDKIAAMVDRYPYWQPGRPKFAEGEATTFDGLTAELAAYCEREGLPAMSACELIHEEITVEQRRYLSGFILRWDALEGADA